MKISKQFLIAFASIALFTSCGDSTSIEAENVPPVTTEEHHDHSASTALELNDGNRWEINSEMQPFLLKGEEILKEYIATNNSDYKTLAAQLKEQNDKLISSCTMDGKSHDVLHEWLHPHLELVKELSKTENQDEANALVAQLKTSYATFHQYFQ